jgi:hypothetical protein
MTSDFYSLIEQLPALSLAELDAVSLLNRTDTKFTLPVADLYRLNSCLLANYHVLEIDGKRLFEYENNYFDTPELKFYKDHHNGYVNRVKVRCRKYVASGLIYFEIKKKEKITRTNKFRQPITEMLTELETDKKEKLARYTRNDVNNIQLILQNNFSRITLVNAKMTERVTIDLQLVFRSGAKEIQLNNLAIIEIKQSRATQKSPLALFLKNNNIRKQSFSKYIFGVLSLIPKAKKNNFLPLLKNIKNIT